TSEISSQCGGTIMNGPDAVFRITLAAASQMLLVEITGGRKAYVLSACTETPATPPCIGSARAAMGLPISLTLAAGTYFIVGDAALLDQIGDSLEPRLVGSWIGVWGGKVITGWHFWDPQPWPSVEAMFGTHDAKYRLKKWVEDHRVERIERFTQSIGDASFSEI